MTRLFIMCQGDIARACLNALPPRVVAGFSAPTAWQPDLAAQFPGLVLHASDTRDLAGLADAVRRARADAILSIQYPWIVGADLLVGVDGRAYNLHNASLPDYRGHNALTHVILNGETVHRPTLHRMAAEVDRGAICLEGQIPVDAAETAQSLYHKCIPVCVDLVRRFVEHLERDDLPTLRRVDSGGTYYPRTSAAALKEVPSDAGPAYVERVARALYFPPHEPPFQRVEGRKVYLLPEVARERLCRIS